MDDRQPWTEDDDEVESEELEADILRANRPFASDRFGTTAEEALEGEPLDRALGREEPEGTERASGETYVVLDEGAGRPHVEDELVGEAAPSGDPFAAPEEAALTVTDEAPGATDHADPHPVDEDEDA